jgi:hypothetical protein
MNLRQLAIWVTAVLALGGCSSTTSRAQPPGPATTAATTATTPAASPVATGISGGEWCALVRKLNNQSGLMVGTHYISPLKETFDQLKVAATLYMANEAALNDADLPPDVKAAQQIEGAYFKALIDHNFAPDTPLPAGFKEAGDTVNAYQTGTCGFVFDK